MLNRIQLMVLITGLATGCATERAGVLVWKRVPSEMGAPASVEHGALILRGQPIRTEQTYRGRVTVACELTLLAGAGQVFLELVPADQPKNAQPERFALRPDAVTELKVGQGYRVSMELFNERAQIPSGAFHLQLGNSPASSRWSVKSFVVR